MKLRINRTQEDEKGFFGGHKGVTFILSYKLDIAPEERSLIEHYKIANHIVHKYESGRSQDGTPLIQYIRVSELQNGGSLQLGDFSEITGAEQGILKGANALKGLIAQMLKFGGEEIIEI